MKQLVRNIILVLTTVWGYCTFAQSQTVEPDSIALTKDHFQELFYESLKQKGIENYDRAITIMEQALTLKPQEATLYHEIGKNYLYLKKYQQAEESFCKAIALAPDNRWFYLSLYDVYYQTKNYHKSIDVVLKLISFNDRRKIELQDDLVSLYMYTNQFDKALELIEILEETTPPDANRELYKRQILKSHSGQDGLARLEEKIRKNPKDESAYITLIYQYSENNQSDKAFETAKLLAENLPESDWAQVSLFKFYLDSESVNQAIMSMYKVLGSHSVDSKIKHRILNEFLIFSQKHQSYIPELKKAVTYFKNDPNIAVSKEIGKFFFTKQNWDNAILFFETENKNNPNDFENIILLLQSYTEKGLFDVIIQKNKAFKELFPLQPELYYYDGLAQNQLGFFDKAYKSLTEGLDYLVDQTELEINFYIQLLLSCQKLNKGKECENYLKKAENLKKSVSQ